MRKIISATLTLMLGTALASAQDTASETNEKQDAQFNIQTVLYHAGLGDPEAMNQLGAWFYSGKNVEKDHQKAFDLWHAAAMQQNAKAIGNLGVCYRYGIATPPDSVTAVRLYVESIAHGHDELLDRSRAAVGRDAFDSMVVGLCTERGVGTPANAANAARAYKAAADMGSADALAPTARTLLASGDKAGALTYARRAADKGYAEGMYIAATLSDPENPAIDLYIRAADKGYGDAAAHLGRLLIDNRIPSAADRRNTVRLLTQAAEAGNTDAMEFLAICLKDGNNTERDFAQADQWLKLAESLGSTLSKTDELVQRQYSAHDPFTKYLEALAAIGNGDFKQAGELAKELNKAKVPEGKLIEALVLMDAKNPKANQEKAAKTLEKIADKCPAAAYILAEMYEKGNGVKADQLRANALLEKAAKGNYAPALTHLGDIYYDGIGVKADAAKAADLYTRALRQRGISERGIANLKALTARGIVSPSAPANLGIILHGPLAP